MSPFPVSAGEVHVQLSALHMFAKALQVLIWGLQILAGRQITSAECINKEDQLYQSNLMHTSSDEPTHS